jgi:hypothetical protein
MLTYMDVIGDVPEAPVREPPFHHTADGDKVIAVRR